jgi:opacity protein-like surface antigen
MSESDNAFAVRQPRRGEVEVRSIDSEHEPSRSVARILVAGLVAWALAAAAPARGQPSSDEDSRWILRGYALAYSTGDEVRTASGGETTLFGIDDGSGFGLDLEFRLSPRLGLEGAVFVGDIDGTLVIEGPGPAMRDTQDIGFEVFSVGANYHLMPDRRFDLAVGGFVANHYFDVVTFDFPSGRSERLSFDADYGFGAKLGADVSLGRESNWVVGAELRYLLSILEAESGGRDLDANPVVLSVGLGYRF